MCNSVTGERKRGGQFFKVYYLGNKAKTVLNFKHQGDKQREDIEEEERRKREQLVLTLLTGEKDVLEKRRLPSHFKGEKSTGRYNKKKDI